MKSFISTFFCIFMSAFFSTVSTAQMTADASANRDKTAKTTVTTYSPLPCKLILFSSCASLWEINGGVQINSNQSYEGVTFQTHVNWFMPQPAHGQILVVVIMDKNGKMSQKKYDYNSVSPRVITLPENGSLFATLREKDARDNRTQIEP